MSFLIFCFLLNNKLHCNDQPIVLMIGTRPEAIKVYPLYKILKEAGENVILVSTGQHFKLLDEILYSLNCKPDFNLEVMRENQDLFYLTNSILLKTKEVFSQINPRLIIVQGDTTTAMASALSAFYLKIPVAHLEAGLRSNSIYSPFPEEVNRCIISQIASYHFTPTDLETKYLEREGKKNIFCTGNTVIDTLYMIKDQLEKGVSLPSEKLRNTVEKAKSDGTLFLLTGHRRESLEEGLYHIFSAVKKALQEHKNLTFFYPVHPNPAISKVIKDMGLHEEPKLILSEPLNYIDMIYLMKEAAGVLTDSGGVQEEAISLNKPTLVLRDLSDRPANNQALIVGYDERMILNGI
ncbi:UDP-N-acetylglucosamine 2-epimerase (non-hydrolyzing), partial [Chlamydiales bacterium]|nr:UDP-N-acetylglucosamine 2-epimerase (non-hydrolyzing) [Chlamydiales bacterium]